LRDGGDDNDADEEEEEVEEDDVDVDEEACAASQPIAWLIRTASQSRRTMNRSLAMIDRAADKEILVHQKVLSVPRPPPQR
jgi:hypothetical protein